VPDGERRGADAAQAVTSREDKLLFLGCFERLCKASDAVLGRAAFVLKALYDADVIDEDTLIHWCARRRPRCPCPG
jgi:hypothetical protein